MYFIPIIPLGSLGEYVECLTCKGTFIPRVLDMQRSGNDEFMANYEEAIKHTMVLIMLADGHIDDNEMVMVQTIINKFGHHDVTLNELEMYVNKVQVNPGNISTYLRKVGPSLNEHGKEILIKCALSVAAADGHIDESELNLIKNMAQVMEMSRGHMEKIVADLNKSKAQ